MLRRSLILAYGLVSYAAFFASFIYSVGFLGNFLVPKSIDSPRDVSLGRALLIDTALLLLFAVQHSVMARPAFKRWWTRLVPETAERSTYVLFSSLALLILFWLWEPLGGKVWQVTHPAGVALMYAGFAFGWVMVFVSTVLINHLDLFGVRQAWLAFRGRPYTPLTFVTPGPYKYIRHPLYVGWLCTFWFTPTMTATHAFFALVTTAYIFVAIQFEERDLAAAHPDYQKYRDQVPMLIPSPTRQWNRTEPRTPSPASEPA